jgi:hypothetical protein
MYVHCAATDRAHACDTTLNAIMRGSAACIALITCAEVPQTTRHEESTTADIVLCWKARKGCTSCWRAPMVNGSRHTDTFRRRCSQYPACGQAADASPMWCTQPPWTASLVHLCCRLRFESGRLWLWSPPASGWSPPRRRPSVGRWRAPPGRSPGG